MVNHAFLQHGASPDGRNELGLPRCIFPDHAVTAIFLDLAMFLHPALASSDRSVPPRFTSHS